MQKVYLLLRNNQQTGPHSLEEIIEIGLKPFDLIWVEGKSAGWCYPGEVAALKPYAPEQATEQKSTQEAAVLTPPAEKKLPKTIFVSLPAGKTTVTKADTPTLDPIEQKEEELRKRAQAYTPQPAAEHIKTTYARSLEEAEEEYNGWVYQQKIKRKAVPGKKLMAAAAVIMMVVLGGGWAIKSFFFKEAAIKQEPVVAKENLQNNSVMGNEEPIEETGIVPQTASSIPMQKDAITTGLTKKEEKKTVIKSNPVAKEILEQRTSQTSETPQEATDNSGVTAPEAGPQKTETQKTEKKTLKETINDLFKKKEENSRDVAVNGNERKAQKRDEEPAEERATINLVEQVQLRSNQTSENWMLGVQGLKLSLINRSNSTVEKATVEVVYYSEQNTVLEKKNLTFSNIGPKKTQTLSAPDNRLADHAEYNLLSATGTQEGYARQ